MQICKTTYQRNVQRTKTGRRNGTCGTNFVNGVLIGHCFQSRCAIGPSGTAGQPEDGQNDGKNEILKSNVSLDFEVIWTMLVWEVSLLSKILRNKRRNQTLTTLTTQSLGQVLILSISFEI
jgi:hypothetical protein